MIERAPEKRRTQSGQPRRPNMRDNDWSFWNPSSALVRRAYSPRQLRAEGSFERRSMSKRTLARPARLSQAPSRRSQSPRALARAGWPEPDMFANVLIANRGEIACRTVRTAQRMGMKSIALHTRVDRGALFTRLADEAHEIGEGANGYLDQAAI